MVEQYSFPWHIFVIKPSKNPNIYLHPARQNSPIKSLSFLAYQDLEHISFSDRENTFSFGRYKFPQNFKILLDSTCAYVTNRLTKFFWRIKKLNKYNFCGSFIANVEDCFEGCGSLHTDWHHYDFTFGIFHVLTEVKTIARWIMVFYLFMLQIRYSS